MCFLKIVVKQTGEKKKKNLQTSDRFRGRSPAKSRLKVERNGQVFQARGASWGRQEAI